MLPTCGHNALRRRSRPKHGWLPLVTVVALACGGCMNLREWVHNGFQVGPNYCQPAAPVGESWIDAEIDERVRIEHDDLAGWWTVFADPTLDRLVDLSHRQNISLREAGFRILAARAQVDFAVGGLFPQLQTASGGYTRFGISEQFFDQWNFGFNLGWELDFWGRFRRAVQAAEATLDASVENYDAVLVTLLGDVANNYVAYRTAQERIRLIEDNIGVQEDVLSFITGRVNAGAITDIDRAQASSNLAQSRAALDQLQIQKRQAANNLCILLGMPVQDLAPLLEEELATPANIPVAPDCVVVGIPADLLRRRPDVRRAERAAAAQAEEIGIAQADLYPAFTLTGTLGWRAANFSDLFRESSLNASVGPGFQWNILNYGRIRSNVRFQEAQFQALAATYQNAVLQADLEVENAIITFLKSQDRAQHLQTSVEESAVALRIAIGQYEEGAVDFNRYTVLQQSLIQQQDLWAQARGQIAQGLIEVYRSLGGGWQIRLAPTPNKQAILGAPPEGPAAGNAEAEVAPPEPLPPPD